VAGATWSVEFCANQSGVDPQACGRLSQAVVEACSPAQNDAR
jgi:hypothetical protein